MTERRNPQDDSVVAPVALRRVDLIEPHESILIFIPQSEK
jgi:hypothetical protein